MDLERLVEAVTKEIICRLEQGNTPTVCCIDCVPNGVFSTQVEQVEPSRLSQSDYVLVSRETYEQLSGKTSPVAPSFSTASRNSDSSCFDLSQKRLLHERDVRDSGAVCGDFIQVGKNTIVTALASDYAKSCGVTIVKG